MKYLGKIESAVFGTGGYQDAEIGLTLGFSYGTRDDPHSLSIVEFVTRLEAVRDILEKARRADIAVLVGVPVEVEIEGSELKSWRVLTEVI